MMKEREIELNKLAKENEQVAEIPGVASKIAQLQEETLKINTLASGKPVVVEEIKNKDLVLPDEGILEDYKN